MPSPQAASSTPPGARVRLLERAVEHVLAHGLTDGSLRSIAPAIDTSHRMLIYHFGSAAEFWDAVLRELRHRDQAELAAATAAGRMPELTDVWAQLTTPENLSVMRVLFQLYGEALADRKRFATFLNEFVDGWLQAIAAAMRQQHGLTAAAARREARMELSLIRGLLLDLLVTGDRRGTTSALREFVRRTGGRKGARP